MRSSTPLLDVSAPQFKADPFPTLARLRSEQPVLESALPDKTPLWLVLRYDDVQMMLKDERFSKDRYKALTPEQLRKYPWIPPMFRTLEHNMLDQDPPDHTRLRALVHRAFTPRIVEQMRERVQQLADELLDDAAPHGKMDLIRDFALPIPMTIISEILGVPEKDRENFRRWSQTLISVSSFTALWKLIPTAWLLIRYLKGFFRERRAAPRDDLASALVQAEEAGDKLNEDELIAMVFLLLLAGHETTVNLIGNGTLALLQNPDQLERLRHDPSLMPSAVEELMRYTSPVFLATERYTREDVTLRGVTIPRGTLTFGVIASANRDESVFPDPDRLDVGREPNRHLGFGHGIHYCIGAPLARLEVQIALTTLLERLPTLRLIGSADALRWQGGLVLRGLKSLPVAF